MLGKGKRAGECQGQEEKRAENTPSLQRSHAPASSTSQQAQAGTEQGEKVLLLAAHTQTLCCDLCQSQEELSLALHSSAGSLSTRHRGSHGTLQGMGGIGSSALEPLVCPLAEGCGRVSTSQLHSLRHNEGQTAGQLSSPLVIYSPRAWMVIPQLCLPATGTSTEPWHCLTTGLQESPAQTHSKPKAGHYLPGAAHTACCRTSSSSCL